VHSTKCPIDFSITPSSISCASPASHYLSHQLKKNKGFYFKALTESQGQRIRELYVPIPAEKPTLGISLQWSPLAGTEDVWHILDVIPNSPADAAGLLPYGDYVIGSPEGLVRGENGLGELIEDVRIIPRHTIITRFLANRT
jgi:S1-C subfamily serine protease